MHKKSVDNVIAITCAAVILLYGGFRIFHAIQSRPAPVTPVVAAEEVPDDSIESTPVGEDTNDKNNEKIIFQEIPDIFKGLIPGEMKVISREEPFKHYEIVDAEHSFQGVAVESKHIIPEGGSEYTYTGEPINVGIVLDADGRLKQAVILESYETLEYMDIIIDSEFFNDIKGKKGKELEDVETLSGATMTSSAILAVLQNVSAAVNELLKNRGSKEPVVPAEKEEEVVSEKPEEKLEPLPFRKTRGIRLDKIVETKLSFKEARYYRKLANRKVQCLLCPFNCILGSGERGPCKVRVNIKGELKTLVYGRIRAYHVDPIEKKPLYHFIPATRAFSVATAGCNLGCIFCQNWGLSQSYPEETTYVPLSSNALRLGADLILSPEQTVELALKYKSRSIAYTYSEPSIFYEYMIDTAKLAKKNGIKNVWITCGYINPEPLRELCKYIDGANVDLKGFSEEFYAEYCYARLAPVLNTLKILQEEGVWLEITNLIVPGGSDDMDMIRDMCRWIVNNLGTEVPLHFSRFFPHYKMSGSQPTPVKTMQEAAQVAKQEGIKHIYLGNLRTAEGEDTYCPWCGKKVIDRTGYYINTIDIINGKCKYCRKTVPGIWE